MDAAFTPPGKRSTSPYAGMEREEPLFAATSEVNGHITDVLQPFSAQEFGMRWAKVRAEIKARGLETVVLSPPESIYYLTNYQTPGNPLTVCIIPADETIEPCVLTRELEGTNMRYRSTIKYKLYDEQQSSEETIAAALAEIPPQDATGAAARIIGYEANSARLTVRSQQAIERHLERLSRTSCCDKDTAPSDTPTRPVHEWADISDFFVQLRNVKSQQELEYVRHAAAATLEGIRGAVRAMRPGVREVEVAGEAIREMGLAGHEYASYPIFLAFGDSGVIGHHAASRRRLREGELVFIEIGGCCNRYHASKMHTVWIGSDPPAWYLEAERLLKQATAAGRAACVNGAVGKDVDAAMRSVMSALSVPHWMSGRSAYAIGTGLATDWAEKNVLIDATSEAVLQANMTLHLVPWIQLPGIGSMGFSDTVQVQASGPATSLFTAEPPRYYEGAVRIHNHANPPKDVRPDGKAMAAVHAFHGRSPRSPLKTFQLPATAGGAAPTVHVKDESARLGVRSFESLGMAYAVSRLMGRGELRPGDTVATMTNGSHGEALAVVARQKGLGCVVHVAQTACCEERLAVLRGLGAEVRVVKGTYDDGLAKLRADAKVHGWIVVCDASWEGYEQVPRDIMHGYTHVFREALDELAEPPTHVLVQGGCGSLLAAAAAGMAASSPKTRVVAVEPIDAAGLMENAQAGHGVDRLRPCEGDADSKMRALNCGTPSAVAWPTVASHCAGYIAVGDEWGRRAERALYHQHGLSASNSGAAGLAGLLAALSVADSGGLGIDSSSRVLLVVTEGVTDPESFNQTCGEGAYSLTPAEEVAAIARRCGLLQMLPRSSLSREEAAATKRKGLLGYVSSLFPSTDSLKSRLSSTDDLKSLASSLSSDDEDDVLPSSSPSSSFIRVPAHASARPALEADVDHKPKPTKQVWTIDLK